MNNQNRKDDNLTPQYQPLRLLGGILIILTLLLIIIENTLKTGWLPVLILPITGFLFLIGGMRLNRLGLVIAGCLLTGFGSGVSVVFSNLTRFGWQMKSGIALVFFATGWLCIPLFTFLFRKNSIWWPCVPAGVLVGASIPLILSRISFYEFLFYISLGLGIGLLIWGVARKLSGLIIPGCLLVATGPGIYYPWRYFVDGNGLTPTGEMLVWFSLGWGLIIIFFKIITNRFIWWPLIPGGVLLIVGWGLYIGGNPQSAVSFISNSSSIIIIIVGLYLLLLRSGIRK